MDYKRANDIDFVINDFLENQTNEKFSELIEALIDQDVILINNELHGDLKKLTGDGVTPLVITDSEKKNYIPLFTGDKHIINDQVKSLGRLHYTFKELCNDSVVTSDYIEGYVLNPFTHGLKLPKPVIEIVNKYTKESK